MTAGEHIAALTAQAHAAADAGDFDRLVAIRDELVLQSARAELRAEDVPALRLALEAEGRVAEVLLAARAEAARRLTTLTARRTGLSRYAGPPRATAGALNVGA